MSPYLHNAAFRSAGLNAVFVPLQVQDLDAFMRRMVMPETREIDLNFRGFAVTNPHKQAIIKYCSRADTTAKAIGAVNTLKFDGDRPAGLNTDAEGFIRPLEKKFGDLSGARVAVVGAGGAARACVFGLKKTEANVTVVARNMERSNALADEFEISYKQFQLNSSQFPVHSFSEFDVVVNTTPLGTRGEQVNQTIATAEQLKNVKLVYDLVYNPSETRLLCEARKAGAHTINGFDMLVAQAGEQFRIWTGLTAPVEEMAAAARKKLDEY
jgi:shikimate dehydrogenase